jgi:hypothetical protein
MDWLLAGQFLIVAFPPSTVIAKSLNPSNICGESESAYVDQSQARHGVADRTTNDALQGHAFEGTFDSSLYVSGQGARVTLFSGFFAAPSEVESDETSKT